MRTLLVCFLAALAVSANVPKPFKGQLSYVYRFDTQVSSSLIGSTPSEIQQQAATRLRADVHISFTNDRHAKVQLKNVRFGELNAELPKSQRVQPFEHFERREIPQELKQQLEMPLSVSYVDGVVERINFHEDDQVFSSNIKRAVLNMMQLNLRRNDVQGLKMQSSIPEEEKDRDLPVFHIPEITLEGECETVYTVQQQNQRDQQQQDERSVFNVTKTINFNKCQRTADVVYGYTPNPAQEMRCLNCLRQQKPQMDAQLAERVRYTHCQLECNPSKINDDNDVERSTFARFELVGQQDKYAIKRTSMLSNYIVKAQNPASQNVITQVVAVSELTFKEQLDNNKVVPSFKQSSTDETLMYSPEWDVKEKRFYMSGDEEFEKNSPFKRVQKKENKVAHALRSILKQWGKQERSYDLDTALQFNRLVEQVRQSSVKEIKNMEDIVRSGSQQQDEQSWCDQREDGQSSNGETCQQHARALFMDALAVAATRNSLYVLAEKIMKKDISTTKAVQALQLFASNQHSPSEQQADILQRLAKHEIAHRSGPLKQTVWLTFGSAVGAICQDKPAQGQKEMFRVEEICPRGKKEQYKQTLMQMWRDASETYEQILALKTIGNAALDNTIDELQKIVKDKQESVLIRMEAIDSMRRLRTSQPQKIRQVLLPIFQNQREQPEIRMTAFSMIMYTHPEKPILDQLTFTVINDRSKNVKSFVLTAMESLAKSPSSAEQEVANHMKAALKMVKISPNEMRSSRAYRVPIYISQKENTEEQNIFFGLASIVSPSNMIPVKLVASLRSAMQGEATEENLQLTFTQKNLEQWYEKMLDFTQYDDSNEQDQQNERKSSKDLRSIYSSLGIKSRRHGSYYLSDEESDESDSQEESQGQRRSGSQQQQKQGRRSGRSGRNSPFGMIVLRTNDIDAAIIPISEDSLPQAVRTLIQEQKPSMRQLQQVGRELMQRMSSGKLQKHFALTFGEKKTKIPTSSGLPLALIRQTSLVASIEAQVQTGFESDSLESNSRGLDLQMKLRTSAVVTHMHEAEVWTPFLTSGVKTLRTMELNTPVELKLRGDRTKLELVVVPPRSHKIRIFGVHTLPMTFTRQIDMDTQTPREPRVRSIHNWALEHTQREYRMDQQSEQAIQIDGHYHYLTNPKQMLSALYTTENNVHIYFNPQADMAPQELKLRISGSAFQKHSQHQRPEMDDFYSSSKNFKSIYEQDDDDYENQEEDKDDNNRRQQQQQRQQQRQQRLSTFSQQYSGEDSYKHELKLDAEARFKSGVRHLRSQISGACDSRLKHCKIFVEAERSPIHYLRENSPWTLKAKLQTILPEIVRQEEDADQKQSRMLLKLRADWGSQDRNEMNVQIQAEPTKTTQGRQQSNRNSENRQDERQSDSQSQSSQRQQFSRFLNKWDMSANFQLSPRTKHAIQRVYEMVKAPLFWQLSTNEKRGEEGQLRVTMIIDPITKRYANISIQTPHERVRAESVELPTYMMSSGLYSLDRRPHNMRSMGGLMKTIQSSYGYDQSECRADDRRVRTFDGVSYRAPLSQCWTVLAKDCSREDPRFVVLMKKDQDQKRVKIITRDNTIELVRTSDNEKVKVTVDGKHVRDEQQLQEAGVELSYDKAYVTKRGVTVEFDGEEARVKLSGQYKNTQCGLCGHYNDEDEDVFRMSNNKRSNDLKEFHRSYVVKNEECDSSKLDKFYKDQGSDEFSVQQRRGQRGQGRRSNSWMDDEQDQDQDDDDEQQQQRQNRRRYNDDDDDQQDDDEEWMRSGEKTDSQNIKPVDRTAVIEYSHKICFSNEPVKRCPRGTSPDEEAETKPVKTQFFCLDRTSVEGRRLQRQARRGRQIDNKGRAPSFVETVQQPTKCIAY